MRGFGNLRFCPLVEEILATSQRDFLSLANMLSVQGLSSGSYLVEVEHPDYVYEPVRIDINSKGKHRARKNNQVKELACCTLF